MRLKSTINSDWNVSIHMLDAKGRKRLLMRDHNIYLNIGREYVTQRISVGAPSNVIFYLGFGIGSARQTDADANVAPLSVDYAGTNTQLDTDPLVTGIERPVRIDTGEWLRALGSPVFIGPTVSDPARVTYTTNFGATDFNQVGGYTKVPISEVGLYLNSADPAQANGGAGNHMVAYNSFAPVPVTAISIQVSWELRV